MHGSAGEAANSSVISSAMITSHGCAEGHLCNGQYL